MSEQGPSEIRITSDDRPQPYEELLEEAKELVDNRFPDMSEKEKALKAANVAANYAVIDEEKMKIIKRPARYIEGEVVIEDDGEKQ